MRLNYDEARLHGKLRFDYPLRRSNSWRVGGPSDCFYIPASIEDLSCFLRCCVDNQPVTFLGLGSNVLIRDSGVRGVVISTYRALNRIEQLDLQTMRAEAGVSCVRLARYCAREDLGGLEFLAGVPGTVGGALAMNAGAFGGEIWDRVVAIETIDRHGRCQWRAPAQFRIGYRSVRMQWQEWFVAGHFRLSPQPAGQPNRRIRELLKLRHASQPLGQFSCGSVFRNPENDHAARLIEFCGLKRHVVGDAQVSAIHANFIINRGNASAADIERLVHHIQAVVADKTGVVLLPEVKIIGDENIQ